MLDIKFIRENPEKIKESLKNRGRDFDLDYLLKLDERRRAKIKETDELRGRQNNLSEKITQGEGDRKKIMEESKNIKTLLGGAEFELKALEEEFSELMRKIPNIPLAGVPRGKNERDNVVLREAGKKRAFGFVPRDYLEIAGALDLIDTERAAKISGSRFGYLKNEAALLEIALVNFALERLEKRNFIPLIPPVLITEKTMKAMGYIDSAEEKEERYFLEKDGLFLVGTSEQSVGPMHAGEIMPAESLPRRYASFSTCFRREAGSYGKDTRGILRVHQFDKLEMFVFSKPEDSEKEHGFLLKTAEELMDELALPYRAVQLCSGDLSHPSAATYDIETWLPGQNEGKGDYRETHSLSNTTDFQARRLKIKLRRGGGETEFVHMLNGTAFAMGRTIIALLENYQREDGSVEIPEALRPYMRGLAEIRRRPR